MNIKLFNKIAAVGLDRLGAGYTASEDATDYAGVLVRSAALHEEAVPESLLGIAIVSEQSRFRLCAHIAAAEP